MMHWHHCEVVKGCIMGSVSNGIITLLNIYYFQSDRMISWGFSQITDLTI